MNILIVGCGIAGATLAAFLREEKNITIDIIEKSTNWENRGYSLGIWDNGRDMLRKLGIAEQFDKRSAKVDRYLIYTGNGKLLRTHQLQEFQINYGSGYTHIGRDVLHDLLLQKIGHQKIQMDTTVTYIKQKLHDIEVHFSDQTVKEYDIIVGADGVHSSIRSHIFPKAHEESTNWRAWFFEIERKLVTKNTVVELVGTNKVVGIFDVGEIGTCAMVAPANPSVWDKEEDRIEQLERLFSTFTYKVPELLRGKTAKDITPTDIKIVPLQKWYKDQIILIGDAAHAMEPFAGLGASMAMEDAYVLAGELIQTARGNKHIEKALAYWQQVRSLRVKQAEKQTSKMRWFLRIKSPTLRHILDLLIPLIPARFLTRGFHKMLKEEL